MEKLRASLENLHNELKEANDIDKESAEMLRSLMADIQNILDRNELKTVEGKHKLLNSLNESAGKFEVSHPGLTGAINIVISSLTNIGV